MNKLKKTILMAALLLTAYCQLPAVFAQGPGFDDGVEDTPIDGGVTLIAAAAVGYGVRRLKARRKS